MIAVRKTCQVVVIAQTEPQENTLELSEGLESLSLDEHKNPVAEWLGHINLGVYSSGIMDFGYALI